MSGVLYYVVGSTEDTRHAVRADPYAWVRHYPGVAMRAICGRKLLVALPGDDRPPPAAQPPGGVHAFCPACTARDAAELVHRRVLTTQSWSAHAALIDPRSGAGSHDAAFAQSAQHPPLPGHDTWDGS